MVLFTESWGKLRICEQGNLSHPRHVTLEVFVRHPNKSFVRNVTSLELRSEF